MRSGITRQAIRRHHWSLLGPACTQVLAAAVIGTMVTTAMSIDTSLNLAERATIVVADVINTTQVFIGVAVYMSMLIVGVTMNLALAGQLRDIAMLRAIGASPGQIRRSVALQAAIVSLPASFAGFVLAIPAGALWVAALRSQSVLPDAVQYRPRLAALPIAAGVGLATSIVGALIAAQRASRVPPGVALSETATGRRDVRPVRTTIGLALVVAGVGLSIVLSQIDPAQADDAAFLVMLAECVGVGMLGPVILHNVARVLRPLARGGSVSLALDNVVAMSRSLSGALIPLVLTVAFAVVKVGTHTTVTHVTGVADPANELWTDYSGTAIYCAFAGVAALNCFITVLVNRGRDLAVTQLAGGTRQVVVRIVGIEAAIVAATALVLAAGVGVATLAPMLHTALDVWVPRIPAVAIVGASAIVGAVVVAGMVAPALILTKRPPSQVARDAE